jgi:hypothetical protein
MRAHHAAVVGRVHSAHHSGTDPVTADPAAAVTAAATSTGFSVVPSPSVPDGKLLATAAIADNDNWAVGGGGVQNGLVEHFDGTRWSVVPTPNLSNGGTGGSFFGVAAAASNDVWAVGVQSPLGDQLIEHWDGKAWSEVTSP